MTKKLIYIAHPFRDDPKGNTKKVGKICKEIMAKGDVIPVSPLHLFSYLDPHEENVLEMCCKVMDACDETWFYGDFQNSEGCMAEWAHLQKKEETKQYICLISIIILAGFVLTWVLRM